MSVIFEVVAKMAEPICAVNEVVHLDGVLAYGAFLDLDETRRKELPPISSEWAEDFDLPLERWELPAKIPEPFDERLCASQGVVWGWKCSAARAEGAVLGGLQEVRKKPALSEMVQFSSARKLPMGSGPVRAKDRKFPTQFAHEWRWCACGDPDETLRLLRLVPGIGKLVGQGSGRVIEWSVHEAKEDWTMWRTLPDAESPLLFGIRAPYHHPSRRVYARLPDAA